MDLSHDKGDRGETSDGPEAGIGLLDLMRLEKALKKPASQHLHTKKRRKKIIRVKELAGQNWPACNIEGKGKDVMGRRADIRRGACRLSVCLLLGSWLSGCTALDLGCRANGFGTKLYNLMKSLGKGWGIG